MSSYSRNKKQAGLGVRGIFALPRMMTKSLFDTMLNEKEKSNANDQSPLILRLSFSDRHKLDLDRALRFFLPYIGVQDPAPIVSGAGIFLTETTSSRPVKIILEYNEDGLEHITFFTDDCLRDYHYYLTQGVEFLNRPEYHNRGLIVHFLDRHDNIYSLLEERNYSEY